MASITYKFKRGQTEHLDDIYVIQGICGGDWWEPFIIDEGDDIFITRDIEITIAWTDGCKLTDKQIDKIKKDYS